MAKAVILMAVYNGQSHLAEQLDSILQQTHTEWELYISDDGSKDQSLEIIRKFQEADPRICQVISNPGPHGAFYNYYHLIRRLKESGKHFDYFFYCDQDDVWAPRKLELQIKRLEMCDSSKPALCNCDLALTDGNGVPTGKRMSDYTDLELKNPCNLFFKHRYIWGTAMAHNRALWDMLEIPDDITNEISHDNFLGKYAVCYGTVVYEPQPLVYYRRHGDNVSTMPVEGKLSRQFSLLPFFRYYRAVAFLSLYFVYHAPRKTAFMQEYAEAVLSGGSKAYRFLKKYHICVTENLLSNTVFTLLFTTGLIKRNRRIKNGEYKYEKKQ